MLQHGDLAGLRGGAVHRLDILRKDVLAAGQNDQLLAAAGDVQIPGLVEIAEVAGAKVAVVGEGLRRGFGVVPIAGEHVRALGQDLAVLRRGVLGGSEAQLDALDRQPGAIDPRPAGRVEGEDRRGLGQAVAGQDLPAETLERPRHLRIEAGAARGEQAQRRADAPVQREEQRLADAPTQPAAHPDRETQQTAEGAGNRTRRAGDLALDAGEHRLVQARHRDHDGATLFLERPHDLGAGDPGRQDHRGADRERRQQPAGERIGVMQRQRQQDPIVGPGQARRLERPQIRADIAVS